MTTEADNVHQMAPAWNPREVVVFNGQHDTRINSGQAYETRSLASLFALEPGNAPKLDGLAFIPSTYNAHDARNHATQRADGSFVALCGDVDHGDHPLDRIEAMVRGFAGDAAWLIFSTAHARADDKRWRIIIPLAQPMGFEDWHDAQHAFFNFMEYGGVEMDRALDRAGQPVYLPNVPDHHAKTGEILRNDDGTPVFYKRATTGTNAPGLKNEGQLAAGMAAIARKRDEDEAERKRMREEAAQRRANRPRNDDAPIMEDFNRGNPVANLLELYGYKQSPRNPADWRSPHQQGDSYATRIVEDSWISLSASDVSSGLGQKCRAGCFGDAYDLFVHYEHSGDHKSAFRTLYQERRAGQPQAYSAPPPPVDPDDPGPDPMDDYEPLGIEDVAEAMESDAALLEASAPELKVVDAFDFDESDIPTRPWIIPGVMLAGYTHMLAAPGGSGKSLFTLQIAIALAKGDPWGTFTPRKRCRTLIINVEDDIDEQRRRLAAARHVMGGDDLRGWIDIVTSTDSIVVAGRSPDGRTIRVTPVVETLVNYIIDRNIDVLIVDPFAETFEGDENDNSEVKWAMRIWRDEIARRTGCAVYLVHHTTKGASSKAGDADIIRGGGAIVNSTRISSTLMPMTEDEAEQVGIDRSDRHLYVRFDDAKANQSLKSGKARWFEKITVELNNATDETPGDEVGALKPWKIPTPFDGITQTHLKRVQQAVGAGKWRENQQANHWVGNAIAEALMLNVDDQKDRKRIIQLLKEWVRNDVLRVVEDEDEKRNIRKFVVVGKWITE